MPPTRATAGMTITDDARKRLGDAAGLRHPWPDATVAEKTPSNRGQWVCVTCGEPFANNLSAGGHREDHSIAWLSHETNQIEEA